MTTLKFIKRGGAAAATIPEDDLCAHEWGSEVPDPLPAIRQQEIELPQAMSITYLDPALDYQQNVQRAQRRLGNTVNTTSTQLPVVMSAAKAKQVADVNLYTAWQQRTGLQGVQLSRKWSKIEPTDVVDIVKGGTSYRVRIVKIDAGRPGIIKVDGVLEDSSIYAQAGAAAAAGGFQAQTVAVLAGTVLVLLDAPLLRDEDDGCMFYAAACPANANRWRAYSLMKSIDGGTTYAGIAATDSKASIGTASAVLGGFGGGNVFDETSTLDVVMIYGTLSSAESLAVLNGANAAMIGSEVIQFRTATLIAAGTYRLSGLLRGRRGTEWAIGSHGSNEFFVLLSDSSILRITAAAAEIGLARHYKGVTSGALIADATPQTFTHGAVALKPFAPAYLGGGRDAAGDLTINWMRRDRKSAAAWRDLPMSEFVEAYEIDVMNGAAVVRTIAAATQTATYTAAQQTSDFGSPQASVSVRVYQISAAVGRGYSLEGTI